MNDFSSFKAEVYRRIASAPASGCKPERAYPSGADWAHYGYEDLARALNELRQEGKTRCTNGVWFVRQPAPKFGGVR